ncbi:MAG: hypothetical protein Q4C13_07020 [Clostridia bacterium]|nr:hypothetical protein [Clostridia bacterium]
MEEQALSPLAAEDAAESRDAPEYGTLDYVKELFLHAVEQEKTDRRRLRAARITMILVACMLAVLAAAALVLVPPLARAAGEAQTALERLNALDLQTLSEDLDGFIDQAGDSLKSVGEAARQLEALDIDSMNEAIGSLTDTVEAFSDIDIEMLNEAIKNLNDSVTPLANFLSSFR